MFFLVINGNRLQSSAVSFDCRGSPAVVHRRTIHDVCYTGYELNGAYTSYSNSTFRHQVYWEASHKNHLNGTRDSVTTILLSPTYHIVSEMYSSHTRRHSRDRLINAYVYARMRLYYHAKRFRENFRADAMYLHRIALSLPTDNASSKANSKRQCKGSSWYSATDLYVQSTARRSLRLRLNFNSTLFGIRTVGSPKWKT